MNSALAAGSTLKAPPSLLVTVDALVSSTPLEETQRCSASITTATLSVSRM
jgi:hypothetical protein